MKQSKNTIIWGLIIIAVGVIFLGNALNIWNIEIFFNGWWTLFIIIPSVVGLFKKQTFFTSFLGLTIGILLLFAAQDIITWSMVGKIFIPILLIIIGLSMVFKPVVKKKINKKGLPEYIGIFSECTEKIGKDFKGANCIAIFGGVKLDLTNAKITEDIIIDCTSVFGSIDLIIPEGVNIIATGVPIFGGIENKSNTKTDKKEPIIYINYVCIFAGIDINNSK